MYIGRSTRNKQLRRTKEMHSRWIAMGKKLSWRLTALWFWLHLIAPFWRIVEVPLNYLAATALSELTKAGFAPSSQFVSTAVLQVAWVLWITNFSWIQIIGLFIYVSAGPFLPYLFFRYGRTHSAAVTKARQEHPPIHFHSVSAVVVLTTVLSVWLMLYANAYHRAPICVSSILTGCLFVNRVYNAVLYSTMTGDEGHSYWNRISAIPLNIYINFVKQIKQGQIRTDEQIETQIKFNDFVLRTIRRFAMLIRGKQGRRRVAVFALTEYVFNLILLGAIAILLWAFAIQWFRSPQTTSLALALLASASHVIPGIPNPDSIRVSTSIQAGISLTAWAIFVLYAGPVASMYPAVQERLLRRVTADSEELRIARVMMYRLNDGVKKAVADSHPPGAKPNDLLSLSPVSQETTVVEQEFHKT